MLIIEPPLQQQAKKYVVVWGARLVGSISKTIPRWKWVKFKQNDSAVMALQTGIRTASDIKNFVHT
jgi:hypothetical protein